MVVDPFYTQKFKVFFEKRRDAPLLRFITDFYTLSLILGWGKERLFPSEPLGILFIFVVFFPMRIFTSKSRSNYVVNASFLGVIMLVLGNLRFYWKSWGFNQLSY